MRMSTIQTTLLTTALCASAGVQVVLGSVDTMFVAPPEAPTDLVANDLPWDGGGTVQITWTASATPEDQLKGYEILAHELSVTPAEQAIETDQEADRVAAEQTESLLEGEGIAPEDARREAELAQSSFAPAPDDPSEWDSLGIVPANETGYEATGLNKDGVYLFKIRAIGLSGEFSAATPASGEIRPVAAFFNGRKLPLLITLLLIASAVFIFIVLARRGMPMRIRKIAGLAAFDEAVGRATEMGRSILYINGIQDMDDLQTVAGVTVLGRVAKTAAEYDAKIEVPTSRSLVMTAAREAVQSSYFSAGRPDAYNPDLIYYVTDEQFGFVAYVSGMMTREKPAACFYMGSFFAESLILAETGNSVGAIQIAGTANPSQLPFFVAACDYTLIGEEFFAASAYLSGQPDQLGSLKGQDIGKILVGVVIVIGVTLATLQAITGSESLDAAVNYLVNVILGS
ncbi:MAG TPA: hypothetical protein DCX60_03010 [Phycisphaerales bacterium]|nr:hypothetical protein [Phycisphaerales bacterium]